MDPNYSPSPAPPPAPLPNGEGSTPYDFIMSSDNSKKPAMSYGKKGNPDTFKKLAAVLVGCVVLLVVGLVFVNILSRSDKASAKDSLALAQQQQEIIRVTGLAIKQQVASQETKNFAVTTQVTTKSTQQVVIKRIDLGKPKEAAIKLGLTKNTKTDEQLATAVQNGNFDKTFVQILTSQLQAYNVTLQAVYKTTPSKSVKEAVKTAFDGTQLLLNDPSVKRF